MSGGFVKNGWFIGSSWVVKGGCFAVSSGGSCTGIDRSVVIVDRVAWRGAASSPAV